MQSQRKAPTTTAFGFRLAVQKLMVIVQLLMGEVRRRRLHHAAVAIAPVAVAPPSRPSPSLRRRV